MLKLRTTMIEMQMNQESKAARDLAQASALEPGFGWIHGYRVMVLNRLHEFNEAAAECNIALGTFDVSWTMRGQDGVRLQEELASCMVDGRLASRLAHELGTPNSGQQSSLTLQDPGVMVVRG